MNLESFSPPAREKISTTIKWLDNRGLDGERFIEMLYVKEIINKWPGIDRSERETKLLFIIADLRKQDQAAREAGRTDSKGHSETEDQKLLAAECGFNNARPGAGIADHLIAWAFLGTLRVAHAGHLTHLNPTDAKYIKRRQREERNRRIWDSGAA